MQLGIYLDLRNPPQWQRDWSRLYGFSLELCEEAERVGLHSAWFSEHHLFADGYLPQPLTFAAAVATRTKRIRLGYNGPQGARRAGRLGEGLLTLSHDALDPYRAGLAEGGHAAEAARMSGTLNVFVTPDPERDWPLVRPHHHHQWESYRQASAKGTGRPAPRPFDTDASRARGLTRGRSPPPTGSNRTSWRPGTEI